MIIEEWDEVANNGVSQSDSQSVNQSINQSVNQ